MNHAVRLALLFIALVFAPVFLVRAGTGPRIVVIVAKGSPITDISKSDLKQLFVSDATSVSGRKVFPFNFDSKTPQRVAFDRAVLGMGPDEVGRFWIDRKIRGQRNAPRSVPSAAYMTKLVQTFPNAIGYLEMSELTPVVQAVNVNGLHYKDARYPLQ